RIAERLSGRPVAAVASARRGVTDHLLSLVAQVRHETANGAAPHCRSVQSSDRAVASGELVAASLLAVALEQLGVRATVLDAREAGLGSDGNWGDARLVCVRPQKVRKLLGRGVVPVATGFQGWHRGRVTTLGRGGSDVTAVALAAALDAGRCELVKETGALHTADPRLVPGALAIPRTNHRFVSELAAAGARVIHHLAADMAERKGVPLLFTSLESDGEPATTVDEDTIGGEALALTHGAGRRDFPAPVSDATTLATVTLVSAAPEVAPAVRAAATAAAAHSGIAILGTSHGPHSLRFVVTLQEAVRLIRTLHAGIVGHPQPADVNSGGAKSDWRNHVGHR
ncbi:MAG: hypothetical protein ACREL3_01370, partial [Gemmatimonadales bacterium]